MKELEKIINECLKKLGGGEKYFDLLDDKICKSDEVLKHFFTKLVNHKLSMLDGVIVSGKFGRMIHNKSFLYNFNCNLIIVNGGIRKTGIVEEFKDSIHKDGLYLFLDDSFYSGTTRDAISNKLDDYGATLVHTLVIYDGSINKDARVDSLFRYHGGGVKID